VLGIGGSATTDGGAGMLQALGVRLTGDDGQEIGRGGAALADLAAIDASGLDLRLADVRILVASDVDNPLLGPSGAAAVFGPQKGAAENDIAVLEAALARWAAMTRSATGRDVAGQPGAGAAGGMGFAALAYLDARLVPGAQLILDLVGFDDALAGADLVITGEGSLDRQTLGGKAPVGVARAAAACGVPVVAVAGRVGLTADELASAGFAGAYSLADREPDESASIAKAGELLAAVGVEIGKDLR
jgi:glycerate kinase